MAEQFVDITDEEHGPEGPLDLARAWFAGPPRWLFGAVVGVNTLLTMVVNAVPEGVFMLWLVTYGVWLGLALAFAARLGLALSTGGGLREVRLRWARWAAVPTVVVLAMVLVSTGAPMRAGFHLAEPAMTEFASDRDAPEPSWVGPYPVEAERFDGGGARFKIKYSYLDLNSSGFAYSPDGPPPRRTGDDYYKHLHGAWYSWVEYW